MPVPHPCAFDAQGWDSTTASSVGFRALPFTTCPSAISYDTTQAAGFPILARSMRKGGIPLLRAAWDFRPLSLRFPPRNLIQHDTGRHPRIQRLDLRGMRNGNQFVGLSDPISRHPGPFPTDQDSNRPGKVGLR